jgi:SET domain-containing protein
VSPATRRAITPGASRYRLKVRSSLIHHRGVFAAEAIPAQREVIEYTGELVPYSRVLQAHTRRWKSSLRTAVYLARLNKRWVINGAVGGNGAELINHCCDPNLARRRAAGRLLFFSRRRIKAGEELTLDYRFHPDAEQIPCHCGSANCRGTINYQRRRKHH